MKLKIKNFQSAEDCQIEIPEKAFTCLVGPTNIGKSAIRRALECVLYNKSEISYIRTGAIQCEVDLTFDDGTNIKWFRDKKTAFYEVNGESFSKLSGSVPEILIKKGFRELNISKDKLAVQVAHQFENIFLLNQPGGKVTEVLSNLGNLNRIIEANKSCQADRKSIRNKLKVRIEDQSQGENNLKSFDGLEDQKNKIKTLKEVLSEIKYLKDSESKMLKISGKLQKSMAITDSLKKIKDIKIPADDISLEKHKTLSLLHKKISLIQNKLNYYNDLRSTHEISFEINTDLAKFAKIEKIYKNISLISNKVESLKKIPDIISEVDVDQGKISNIKRVQEKLEQTKKALLYYREQIKEVQESLKGMEDNLSEVKKDLKVCPLCDSNLC